MKKIFIFFVFQIFPTPSIGETLVDAQKFRCFVENVGSYIEKGTDPVVVIFSECLSQRRSIADIIAGANNLVVPDPENFVATEQPKHENVFPFTQTELRCIEDYSDANRGEIFQFTEIIKQDELDVIDLEYHPCISFVGK